ncbi:SdrD B-like domain-containing protein [Nonlabens tegetincola]|uniref:SdrD B-like domain-containing protein n=1 Tax=Nonlabens tegetincola TaxID=323273 RepID=UPI000CF4F99C
MEQQRQKKTTDQCTRHGNRVVYNDVNGNGTQDAGEPGIENVEVTITDSAGQAVTVQTDATGTYTAQVAAPGTASVDIDDADLPVGSYKQKELNLRM